MLGPYSYQSPSSLRERKRDVGINLVGRGTAGALGDTDLEAVLETLVDVPDVGHTATASGLSSLGLLTPVDCIAENRKPGIPNINAAVPKTIQIAQAQYLHERIFEGGEFVHLRVLAEG